MTRLVSVILRRRFYATGRPARNEEITAQWVRLVNPRSSSHPSEPRLVAPARTADILRRLDLSRTTLVLVDADADPPIAKLVDRADLLTSAKSAKKADKKGRKLGGAPKEIQLTWATTDNDLAHKLKPAQKALADGVKADVVVATPPGRLGDTSRRKRPEEKRALAARIEAIMTSLGAVKAGEKFEGAGVVRMVQTWEAGRGGGAAS